MAVPVAASMSLMFLRVRPQTKVCMVSSSLMASTWRFSCGSALARFPSKLSRTQR